MAKTISRPAWFNVPEFMINLVFGEMGQETMLYSQRAFPEKLRASGFDWRFEQLADVLHQELIAARSDRWGGTSR